MWKRGEIAPQEQFLLFSTIFYTSLTSGVKLHIHLLNVVVKCGCSTTLIYRARKCFRESLGIRVNESRLYFGISASTPDQPKNVKAVPISATEVNVSWSPVATQSGFDVMAYGVDFHEVHGNI